MASSLRFPAYYVIVAVLIALLTFYYISTIKSKNDSLARDVKYYKESLAVSKEKFKLFAKRSQKNLDRKDEQIKKLEHENMNKHNAVGELNSKLAALKSDVQRKSKDVGKLHQLAANHKEEISNLKESVSEAKEALKKLSEKTHHLMSNHTKLEEEKRGLLEHNENLKNEVNQHRSERGSLGQEMAKLIKEKELLGRKVEELTTNNNKIQKSIKTKLKESYLGGRSPVINKRVVAREKKQDELGAAGEVTPEVPMTAAAEKDDDVENSVKTSAGKDDKE